MQQQSRTKRKGERVSVTLGGRYPAHFLVTALTSFPPRRSSWIGSDPSRLRRSFQFCALFPKCWVLSPSRKVFVFFFRFVSSVVGSSGISARATKGGQMGRADHWLKLKNFLVEGKEIYDFRFEEWKKIEAFHCFFLFAFDTLIKCGLPVVHDFFYCNSSVILRVMLLFYCKSQTVSDSLK